MKKFLSAFLCIVMLFTCAYPAFAAVDIPDTTLYSMPIIRLQGDSDPIYDSEDNLVFSTTSLGAMFTGAGDSDSSNITEAALNIVKPFILEGILTNKWDNYYDAIYKEMSDIFEKAQLDDDGNPKYGTNVSKSRLEENITRSNSDAGAGDGKYSRWYYRFYYDWRLDPLTSADSLYEYIENVKRATGFDKVCVQCQCLGINILLAYLTKYGYDSIYGVGIDGSVAMGTEILGESISGDFSVDSYAIRRFIEDCYKYDIIDELSPTIDAILDYAIDCGVISTVTDTVKYTIYNRIVEGVTSALALSTFFSWPGYWAAIGADKYDAAINYVFGAEGSEKRVKYAGLISKLDDYHNNVGVNVEDLLLALGEKGINVVIISKYGSNLAPICKSSDQISDQFATVVRSSFGATVAKDIFSTLDESYIAAQTKKGLEKYISPDKQIDASTCLYPDSTFFLKNSRHSHWSNSEYNLMALFMTADHQMTVDDVNVSQFMVIDPETDIIEKMNEENCHTESWYEADNMGNPNTGFFTKISVFFKSLIAFFKEIWNLITK